MRTASPELLLRPLAARAARASVRCKSSSAETPLGDFQPLESDRNTSWGGNSRGLGHNNYLGKILNARVYEIAMETPLQPAPILSGRLGNNILIKREDLQPVFSFKIRGAYNKIAKLPRETGLFAAL